VKSELPVTFLWPALLWLLLMLLPLIALYLRMQVRRRRLAESYGNFGLVQQTGGKSPGLRRHIPALFFLIGLAILIMALARPQMVVSLPRVEETVILAFDVSGSMAANDMQPTRMDAAKTIAKDFVTHQPITVQIGIVAFSDNGFSVQPPTNDQQAILASINRIEPQRGTSLASGILVSLDTIAKQLGDAPLESSDFAPELLPTPTPLPTGTYSPAVIILLSDGENNVNPDPLSAAQAASDRGVRIHTVGLGSASGTTLKVNGFSVHTQLDEALLQQISQMTGGTYHNAVNEEDMRKIYADINPQLVVKPEKMEVTSLFAGVSLLFLLAGGALSLLWFSRVP
jgi:Ca-activated chloride channel homolog